MDTTYLFYDLETSGLNKCFDQVLQFAAIRTDLELNELERHEFLVKLNPDTIPSPKAVITHRLAPKKLQEVGIPEYEAIRKIHDLFNIPDTISIGYNTLGFDDEFLRFSFYRNLMPPYTHQYNNGCRRIDLYPMAVFYYLFKNKILHWPKVADVTSLKLEHLNAANNFCEGIAHDAMFDTEVTLKLARHLQQDRPLWDYACGYFSKAIDLKRMAKLPEAFSLGGEAYKEGLLLDGIFGPTNCYQAPVVNLGTHRHYKNQTLWLRIDSEKLSTTTLSAVEETTHIYRKKIGETGFLLEPSERFSHHLSKERSRIAGENKLWLQKDPKILKAISEYYREYKYPLIPNVDLDALLYLKGFKSAEEERLCRRFRSGDIKTKLALLHELPNGDLRDQMLRILGRNYQELLPNKTRTEFNKYLGQALTKDGDSVLIDYRGDKRLTPEGALQEITKLRVHNNLTKEQSDLLDALECHILHLPNLL